MTAIPRTVDAITAAWLGEALAVPVVSVAVVEAHSGTTGRARIRVEYARRGERPEALFVKLAPFDERQRRQLAAWGIGVAEARAYRALGGEWTVRAPACWYATYEGDDFVMVLEDLVDSGVRFPRPRDGDVAEVAAAVVEALGLLHAPWWSSPRFADDLAWLPDRLGGAGAGGARFVGLALERFGADMGAAFRRLGALFVARTDDMVALWARGDHTLVHGDAHMGNLFLDGRRAGFFDWALASRAPGMRDVGYFLASSVPPEVRRVHEAALLERYREALARRGIALRPEQAWNDYRLFAAYAWVAAASTAAMGSLWQAERVARGGMERATAAIEDLDSVGLVEELLG